MRKTKSGSYINDMVWWFSNHSNDVQQMIMKKWEANDD